MALPQPGIFALGTSSHAYLELDLLPGTSSALALSTAAGLREPRTTIGGCNLVAGFRPELWAKSGQSVPDGLSGFNSQVVGAGGYTLPATQHDMVMWLSGPSYDVVFDLSRSVVMSLAGYAKLVHEVVGWPYHHDRDLTGFIDGTENPPLVEATRAAVIPPGQPGEGGSILLLQQWEHDVPAWEGLGVPAQEQAMGRRKTDSEELSPKPPASHVARNDQDRLGKIFRRNVAYGDVHNHGTIFVGFCARQHILASMLEAMVGLDGGPRDALTLFTRALTGAYYFIPSADALAAVAGTGERAG
ncbi:MAG TPA: Dyp-type peroxidase [Candidatus Limnocylindrales bacterium]